VSKETYLVLADHGEKSDFYSGDGDAPPAMAVYGPFDTIKAAKEFIIADAMRDIRGDDDITVSELSDSNLLWGSKHYIVRVMSVVHPDPQITLGMELFEVAKPKTAEEL
jgi:hypothetical protein